MNKKDNSMRKMDLKELQSKYRLFKDLMDRIPDVIYFKDREGRLVMVNEAHARGLGLKPEEVAGKTDFDIFPKERAEKMAKDDLRVITTGRPIIDKIERATRADGVDNYVSTTKIPRYDERGRIVGLLGITRDITHRMQVRHLEDEKEHIQEKLEALQEVNKIKSEFVSAVSHELRTPLAIIKEAIGIVSDGLAGPVTDKQKELIVKANNNVGRLQRIIDELLDISRIETGRLRLHYSLVNLLDLIRDSAAFFTKLAGEKNISLQYRLPREEINIFIDAERIIQVINNLIGNAIRFTEEQGEIKVEVKVLEDRIRTAVIDTGIGIAKDDLPRLFNRFVQVSKAGGAQKKGVGLGLFIVKELVEKHGGEAWAESKLGVGSTFYFTLPRFYTINILSQNIKDQINSLLKENKTVYLVNISVVSFREIRRRVEGSQKLLVNNLKDIIDSTFRSLFPPADGGFKIAGIDTPRGEYSVILPQTSEEKIARACGLLREKINAYFRRHKVKNIFVNIGRSADFLKIEPGEIKQAMANLCVKKIFIGLDKRRFKRIEQKIDIEVSSAQEKAEAAQTIDISLGGICFLSARPLEANKEARIKFKLPRAKAALNVCGRVAWVKALDKIAAAGADNYRVGIEFLRLKDKDKKILRALLRKEAG